MIQNAVDTAQNADVAVLVVGLITCQEHGEYCQEAEALDRVGIGLPPIQEKLIRAVASTSTPIVLIILSGGTVSIPWAAESLSIGAIIQAWYPGEEGGTAIAKVVYGEVNPSG